MWKIITFALIFISNLGLSGFALAEGDEKAPILYRPIFETQQGSANAGTAFIIKYRNQYYAISAQHLIGTAGGLKKDYNGAEMATIFKSVTLNPIFRGYNKITSKTHINIPKAEAITDATARHDVFISPLGTKIDSTPLTLSKRPPIIGEKIVLYSAVASSKSLLHTATVSEISKDRLVYSFDDKNINLRATSGAPVLNRQYQVIGINLAGGSTSDGAVAGFANPAQSIVDHLPR